MGEIVPVTNITMNKLNITSLSSSIYGPGSVTFENDTQAFTVVEFDYANITRVTWC